MRFQILLVIGAMLALQACDTGDSNPVLTPAPSTPTPPLSTVAATLSVPEWKIAEILNDKSEGPIANLRGQVVKCLIGQCRANLFAERTGPITIADAGGLAEVHVPFRTHMELFAPGLLSQLHVGAETDGEATARMRLEIGSDWALRSETTGKVHLDGGSIQIGPISTSLADIWNGNEEILSTPLWHGLDKKVAGVDVRSQAISLWTRLFVPIEVAKEPRAWLILRPEQISVARPYLSNGAAIFSIGIGVRGHVTTSDTYPQNPVSVLPAPVKLGAPSDSFAITVPILLSYGDAARIAMRSMPKEPLRIGGVAFHFSQLKILPSGRDVVLATHFCIDHGSGWADLIASCGTGYLRGTPRFDAARQMISVTDLNYDITSGGFTLKLLRLLTGDALAQALEPHLRFDVSQQIARLDNQVAVALSIPRGKAISLSARITSFSAPSFTWTKDGFLTSVSAAGRVETKFQI